MRVSAAREVIGSRLLLLVILIAAGWARLTAPDLGWFMMDQARDATAALGIAQGTSFPMVGPVARGLYALGPLYYYLIAAPFLFSKDPAGAVLVIGFLNVASVYLAFRLGKQFFGLSVGLIAAALYAVSPMAVVSSSVMWNPGFVPFFTAVALYGLFEFIVAGRPWGLTATLAALACLLQVHLSAVALVLLLIVTLVVFRPSIPWQHAALGLGLAAALFVPYAVFEATRGFQGIADAQRFFGTEGTIEGSQPWITIAGKALAAPFTIPAAMADVSSTGLTRSVLRSAQYVELVLVGAGLLWLVGSALARTRRDGRIPKAHVLLILWIVVPLVVLAQKKQALMWYYFDLLYPSQFLAAGLLVRSLLRLGVEPCRARTGLPRGARRAIAWSAIVVVAVIGLSQALLLATVRRDILAQGALRLPTAIGLRFPDPLWWIKDKGFIELMPERYKREVTAAILADSPMDRVSFYLTVHGSAFEDLIEDRGYFYRVLHGDRTGRDTVHHALVRARGCPAGIDGAIRAVGPFRLVRYRPLVRYAFWRYSTEPRPDWFASHLDDASWPLVRLPARRLPDLTEYAQTPLESWGSSPVYFQGRLDRDGAVDGLQLVVALRDLPPAEYRHRMGPFYLNGQPLRPVATRSYLTALTRSTEAVIPIGSALREGPNTVAFVVEGDYPAFDLDVYEVRCRGSARD
jgi:4-amino-4-deoxy-L-arabinose transferase-like glycosyltransferase